MKVSRFNDVIIVYVYNKDYISDNIKKDIENILLNLEKYYDMNIESSYDLKLYTNKYYGYILEIKEDYNILENIVNIKLKVLKDTLFLYEIEDPLDYIDNEIYYYNNKYYINIKNDNIQLYENSQIIYGNEVYKIIGSGIKL